MYRLKAAAAGLTLLLAACGGGSMDHSAHDGPAPPAGDGHSHSHSAITFGVAADAAEAERTIKIAANDSLRFDPNDLEVEFAEVVRFVITNKGSMDHEFVLGDAAYQDSHRGEMGSMMHSEGNGVFLKPGANGEVTWTFTSAGEILFACHVEDHYSAGMVGSITVK